jgi:predicted transcriptional regulator
MPSPRLSRFELEVMTVLWARGASTVRELLDALPEKRRPAYTTVQTIVARLEEKGAVRRAGRVGNAQVFAPAITRRATHRRLVDELLGLLGGSQPLLAHLVESGRLSLADLRALEKTLVPQGEGDHPEDAP